MCISNKSLGDVAVAVPGHCLLRTADLVNLFPNVLTLKLIR